MEQPGPVLSQLLQVKIIEAIPKCQILELQPMKIAVLQPVGRKTARAGYKITDFGTGSYCNQFKKEKNKKFLKNPW
jgi:hypothetical protein